MIFAHGSRFGGHALFIKDRKLYYVYNFLGIPPEQQLVSRRARRRASTSLGIEFAKERIGEHGESHGTAKLYIDEKVVAEGADAHADRELHALRRGPLRRPRQRRPGQQGVHAPVPVHGRQIEQVEVNVGDDQYIDLEQDGDGGARARVGTSPHVKGASLWRQEHRSIRTRST